MSEVKKIATRDSYGNALAELGATCPDLVVLDADLSGATINGLKSTVNGLRSTVNSQRSTGFLSAGAVGSLNILSSCICRL